MDAAGLIENENADVLNVNNGERSDTYVIKGSAAPDRSVERSCCP